MQNREYAERQYTHATRVWAQAVSDRDTIKVRLEERRNALAKEYVALDAPSIKRRRAELDELVRRLTAADRKVNDLFEERERARKNGGLSHG